MRGGTTPHRKGIFCAIRNVYAFVLSINFPHTVRKRAILIAACAAIFAAFAIPVAQIFVNGAAEGRIYSDVTSIPHRHVGLVLGCSKRLASGGVNPFFANRIAAAAALFRAGKVDSLIVSGDNHIRSYDEPTDMKASLVAAGVPADRIYCDYAGFHTLDSVVRSRAIFGQREITVISQEFHNRRAIFIAKHYGIDAIGFNAADISPFYAFRTHFREPAIRVKTILDVCVFHKRPRFLGRKVLISTVVGC